MRRSVEGGSSGDNGQRVNLVLGLPKFGKYKLADVGGLGLSTHKQYVRQAINGQTRLLQAVAWQMDMHLAARCSVSRWRSCLVSFNNRVDFFKRRRLNP